MVNQYPDTASVTIVGEEGIDPDTGYPIPPIPPITKIVALKGRYDAKISDQLKQVADAKSFIPVFVFYMPLGQPNVPINSELKVQDISSGIEFIGIVQMFNKGMFNAFALCSNV